MHAMIERRIRRVALAAAFGLLLGASASAQDAAPAQQAANAGAPGGFVAPAEPRPDETNAQRGKTQPGNNAPLWRAVRESGAQPGVTTAQGPEAGTLIQGFTQYPGSRVTNAGDAWRQTRNQWIIPLGGALLVLALAAAGLVYWRKGTLHAHGADTGRVIERFTALERGVHLVSAAAFVVLAVSGLVMAFGKFVLLPVMGATLFGWLSYALKTMHNFAGPVFAISLVVFIFTYLRDNLPQEGDAGWLLRGGGLFAEHEIPSHRFNAGEKTVFWVGVIVLGLLVVASGLVLDKVVVGMQYLRSDMQVAHMVHAVSAIAMMALFCGHIYMGTVGVKGAYEGMRTGYVDEAWAEEHHKLWYRDIKAGKIPAQRSPGAAAPSTRAAQSH